MQRRVLHLQGYGRYALQNSIYASRSQITIEHVKLIRVNVNPVTQKDE